MADSDMNTALFERRLMRERAARKEAEQLLEARSRELFEANQSLNEAYNEMEKRVHERTLALKIARDEALTANKAKSEFLSSMSHELRTPLNAILGFSQLLKMDCTDDDQCENIQEIENAGQHLLNLINEVLDLAKIEAGAITLNIDHQSVDKILQECSSLATALAQRFNIGLDFQLQSELQVFADPIRLKQIVLNLVSNAIKYNNPKGSVTVWAEAGADEMVSILVRDTGPGISKQDQQQLFEPFNRMGAENSEVEGTGIGLMITRQLAEMMGGQIRLDSEPGRGSTFIIDLPRVEGATASTTVQAEDEFADAGGITSIGGQQKLLYIEDERSNLRLVEKALVGMGGLTLLTTMDADTGVEQALNEKPNLILLDINLPDKSGFHVLEQLRSQEETRHIPVIAVTSDLGVSSLERAREVGFDYYIGKPIDLDKLHGIVSHYLKV